MDHERCVHVVEGTGFDEHVRYMLVGTTSLPARQSPRRPASAILPTRSACGCRCSARPPRNCSAFQTRQQAVVRRGRPESGFSSPTGVRLANSFGMRSDSAPGGRASYSAQKAMRSGPFPHEAVKAVGMPYTPVRTSNPRRSKCSLTRRCRVLLREGELWMGVNVVGEADHAVLVFVDRVPSLLSERRSSPPGCRNRHVFLPSDLFMGVTFRPDRQVGDRNLGGDRSRSSDGCAAKSLWHPPPLAP